MQNERVRLVGLAEIFRPFEPCAYYVPALRLIIVATKDCSSTTEWVSRWSEINWENYRPWYAPWKKCVGFSVYLHPQTSLSEDSPVTTVLDRVLEQDPNAFGKYRDLFYRRAKHLSVLISG